MSRNGRMPLIAGNWKMHYNHLEALALVQKLAFALKPQDYAAAEVVVLPPFTALRSWLPTGGPITNSSIAAMG